MMKLSKMFVITLILFSLASCEKEESGISDTEQLEAKELLIPLPPLDGGGSNPLIGAAAVRGVSCGNGRRIYTVYAFAGNTTVPYDRVVSIAVIKRNSNPHLNRIVDWQEVTIPANANVSNNRLILQNHPGISADEIRPWAVYRNGSDISSSFSLVSTFNAVASCTDNITGGSSSCGSSTGNVLQGPPDADMDNDDDGICDQFDPDDDNDNIPDTIDDDDDGDGVPDHLEDD